MRILFLGDVVGRSAREVVISSLPDLKKKHKADIVIVNGENSVNGFGITGQACTEFYAAGVDCITTGNHIWDQRSIISHIDNDKKLIRPANYPRNAPGRGFTVIETVRGEKVLVINIMGRIYMDAIDDPFACIDNILKDYSLAKNISAIFVDFHAEATSEKVAMGHYCDGRITALIGTHTHIPTADAYILENGTGYQTDAGMCGCYNSVIGNNKETAVNRFLHKVPRERLHPAEGSITICGTIVDVDKKTGLCFKIQPLRIGGLLQEALIDG